MSLLLLLLQHFAGTPSALLAGQDVTQLSVVL
jgi:hypothetical protein